MSDSYLAIAIENYRAGDGDEMVPSALLAIAEELRTANLIATARWFLIDPNDPADYGSDPDSLLDEIRRRLDLD